MKIIVYHFLLLFFLISQGYACEISGVPTIPISFPCRQVVKASNSAALEAAAECAESVSCGLTSGYCPEIFDAEGNPLAQVAVCNCAPTEPDPEYCWTTATHPYMGGCAGIATCYYVMAEEDDCECDADNPNNGPQCEIGDPINIYSGNSKQVDSDIELNSPFEKSFKFYRTYRSRSDLDAEIGYSWAHNYNVTLVPAGIGETGILRIRDESNRNHYF